MSLAVKPNYVKGQVVSGYVYGEIHYKDLLDKISIVKSKVLYPSPRFLSSAICYSASMPKKNSNGFINQTTFASYIPVILE